MNRSTIPSGVAGKPITPIMSGSNAKKMGSSTPNGTGGAKATMGSSMPSGQMSQPQRGGANYAQPSYKAPDVPMKTVGRHTAITGLTPTSMPGVSGQSFPSGVKSKAPGNITKLKTGSTQPSGAVGPVKLSGPSGKIRK